MSNKFIWISFLCFANLSAVDFPVFQQNPKDSRCGENKAREFNSQRQRFDQNWEELGQSKIPIEMRNVETKDLIEEVFLDGQHWKISLQSGKSFVVDEDLTEWEKFDLVYVRMTANPDADVLIWNIQLSQGALGKAT